MQRDFTILETENVPAMTTGDDIDFFGLSLTHIIHSCSWDSKNRVEHPVQDMPIGCCCVDDPYH